MYDRNKDKKKTKQVEVNGKLWNKESLKDLLKRNNKAIERAILLLYSFQTYEERTYGHTETNNGVGFNRLDANILSSFAEQLNRGYHLTEKQIAIARPKLLKYTGQILNYMIKKSNLEIIN